MVWVDVYPFPSRPFAGFMLVFRGVRGEGGRLKFAIPQTSSPRPPFFVFNDPAMKSCNWNWDAQIITILLSLPHPLQLFFRSLGDLHSRKLTWIPKMMVWKRYLPLKMAMFGIYVRFLGCIPKGDEMASFPSYGWLYMAIP